MKFLVRRFSATALAFLGSIMLAPSAHAATLMHEFIFELDAVDNVGSASGALLNGANVSGGVLHLDGQDDYVEFSSQLVPTGGAAFSVALQARSTATSLLAIAEIISQGITGGSGFYLGYQYGQIRLTDQFTAISALFPTDQLFHDYVITSAAGDGTRLYLDGTEVFFSPQNLLPTATGTNTRIGTQFNSGAGTPYNEYFAGEVDNVKIYSGALTANEAVSVFTTPVPVPASLVLMGSALAGFGFFLRRR